MKVAIDAAHMLSALARFAALWMRASTVETIWLENSHRQEQHLFDRALEAFCSQDAAIMRVGQFD